ncbi:TDP-N-acetylfucosamine:lipid II N-acetylfucosaminyltransferase [Paraliobacillus ryukyuensis]|uniref:4-alpha-L-fucosyltransferase (Glycosyl transferase family 56) n=1 Tax=Paraliobacillus ryukyuensis TaxID=200904 RepID=A0A366EE67_9BACI|nr:TDP-N-acetylfucosamine:lipid II N-acetylfucosaminyltransferase [Paraliobacillus ryukyuensis]RBP00613.1 4-alpha-L-fucosyltransferase (glycosyl transferase family 56) [Paraliobacillus ryukyuensis]
MNILHIFKNTNEKFYNPFISFINANFNYNDHYFMIEKYTDKNKDTKFADNVELVNKRNYFRIVKRLYTSDKIILHSLMSPRLMFLLFFQPWLLKKCYWVIWGADLYYHNYRHRNIKSNINENMRKKIIKNVRGVITHVKSDYELAKKWYGTKGEYYYSSLYPSNLYQKFPYNNEMINSNKTYIQIGNSADPSNNHFEVLDKLQKYNDLDIELICPLSYGNREYASQVIEYGKKFFGDKFIPVTEFQPFDEYRNLLAKIDVAIFNHNRQQALGNIITLLGLGKKVYLRKEITTWQFCIDHDLKIYSANDELGDIFIHMSMSDKRNNINKITTQFSEKKLMQDWNTIFEGDIR